MDGLFDEKAAKDFIDKFEGKEKEVMREKMNLVAEILYKPSHQVSEIMLAFKAEIDVTSDEMPGMKSACMGLYTSFVATIMSNLQKVFEFEPELMQDLLEQAIKTNQNIDEQEKLR